MKKLLAVALAAGLTTGAGLALADGSACGGKKCPGHHWHKKHAKQESKTQSAAPPADTNNSTK